MEEKRRLLKYLQRQKMESKSEISRIAQEALKKLGFLNEKEFETNTPNPVRRCVASVLNKGSEDSAVDAAPSDEKSKAFAICWAQYNKGNMKKGFGGSVGKERKSQYKTIFKKKK